MGSKFHAEMHTREGVTYLKVGGVIDEDNNLSGLEPSLGPGSLMINLGEIERINSCGVRDWVNWLGRVERAGARVILLECSPPIVSQINLVHNFTGGGVVKSFYAPYYCPRCQREKLLLLETRDLAVQGPPFLAPTCRCDECDGPMEFDDMEESYFAFLSNARKLATDPGVDAVMQEFGASEATGSGSRLRPRGVTGSSATPPATPPEGPQPPAPQERVVALPSVPAVPQPSRPASGVSRPASGVGGSTFLPFANQPPSGGAKVLSAPATSAALAHRPAEQAQAGRGGFEEPRSPLAWALLIFLLLLAMGLLAWVFMT